MSKRKGMNQFNKMKIHSNKSKIANDFDYILNNMWCTYSEDKAVGRWRNICKQLDKESYRKISIEIEHVQLGHGREQALMALKAEMINYLQKTE